MFIFTQHHAIVEKDFEHSKTFYGQNFPIWKDQSTRQPASTSIFLPNYKHFDQFLVTVKNKTTVLNVVFEGFLQTSVPPLISIFYSKKGITIFG